MPVAGWMKGSLIPPPPPVEGQVERQMSPVRQIDCAEIAVVEAYGNCDDATVDVEKKTPAVQMDVEVADVVVLKVEPWVKAS